VILGIMAKAKGITLLYLIRLYYSQEYLRKWITPKRKLCGLFEVLIAPLIAFQIYKRRSTFCYDFSDYGGIRGGSENR
jgi:hypothetical protein